MSALLLTRTNCGPYSAFKLFHFMETPIHPNFVVNIVNKADLINQPGSEMCLTSSSNKYLHSYLISYSYAHWTVVLVDTALDVKARCHTTAHSTAYVSV